jgi:hypothetical protein
MNRDDAEEAIAALGRAITALGHTPPDLKTAQGEIADAMQIVGRVYSPYADPALRPGLNFHQNADG